jgi:N-glycosylase/DNA lyase
MNPLRVAWQFVFGCRHARLSRVFTIKMRTYQVCFDCGKECAYSLELMQPVSEREVKAVIEIPRDETNLMHIVRQHEAKAGRWSA